MFIKKNLKLACAIGFSLASAWATANPLQHPPAGGQAPVIEASFADGVLHLPYLALPSPDGGQNYFRLNLQLVESAPQLLFAILPDFAPVGAPGVMGAPNFDLARMRLHVPRINLGGTVIMADFDLLPSGQLQLQEFSADLAGSQNLRRAMIRLDRAMIPLLFMTNTDKAPAAIVNSARVMLGRMEQAWQRFAADYAATGTTPEWQAYFDAVSAQMEYARHNLDAAAASGTAPSDLMVAHEAFETTRNVLHDLRSANGMHYFIDPVTVFHHAMEGVVAALNGVTAPEHLTPQVMAALQTSLPPLLEAANALQAEDWSAIATELGFGPQKMQTLVQAVNAQKTNFEALLSGDLVSAIAAGQKIKPLFVKLFLSMGDFLGAFPQDMAAMEKAYAAALFLTNNAAASAEQTAAAQAAMAAFKAAWGQFSGRFPPNLQPILGWNPAFTQINASIAEAETALAAATAFPADLSVAHDALEIVREMNAQVRGLENIDYVMDHLSYYHRVMEPIALMAKNATAAGLSGDDMSALVESVGVALAGMQALQGAVATMSLADFGFDAAKHEQLVQSVQNQLGNLNALQQALDAGDAAAALAAAQKVKPQFANLFKAFGGL